MRSLLHAGLVLGVLTAACDDSVGPKSPADPQETAAQLAALHGLFDAPALESFESLSDYMGPAGLGPSLAVVASPFARADDSDARRYAERVKSVRSLGRFLPSLSVAAAAAAIFPPEVAGKTFEWNPTTRQYEPGTRPGAPDDGVRFILYAIDPLTGLPALDGTGQPIEVGFAQLDDLSTPAETKLGVLVAGPNGSPVYVDYTVSIENTSATSARIRTTGYLTNGTDQLDFRGTITVSGTPTSVSVTQDVHLDVDARDIHVILWERVTVTETSATLRIGFRFEHGGEIVTLEGDFTFDELTQSIEGDFAVAVDGGPWARCAVSGTATSFSLTCEGADADGLTADERTALDALGDAIGRASEVFASLLLPPLNFIGA